MTNNNPEEVENLIKNGYISNTPNPDDYVVVTAVGKAKGKRSKSNRYPNTKYVVPVSALGGGISGPVCDITMEQKAITFSPEVTVSVDWNTQLPITDILIPGQLELYCEPFMNVWFNTVDMSQPDWNTQYTGGPWGFGDLSDIESRTYAPWNIFSSVFEETVLFHAPSNTYWAIYFTSYDFRNGFTYTRRQIFLPDLCELTFSDGSKMNSAAGLVTGPNVTENVDADGVTTYTVGGSAVNYSNVLFVDPVFGNNLTALPGRFDLPYSNVGQASTVAATLGGGLSSRVLVYIRKGSYTGSVDLKNWVDFYCEPGVVFSGSGSVRDLGVSVNSNFYGYAKFVSKTSSALAVTGSSTVNFQFDYIDQSSSIAINTTPPIGGQCEVTIEGNKIFSTTLGVGYAIALRRKANVTFNIKSWIWAYHSVFDIRDNYDGVLTVNCPKIRLANDNLYGGNFKQAVISYSSTANARMTFNADFVNEGTAYLGGISGMITNWSSTSGIIEVNGNIYAGETVGLYCSGNQAAGRMVINGNIFSNIQPVYVASENSCYVKNGVVSKPSTFAANTVRTIQNAKLFMSNVQLYNAAPDIHLIKLDSTTSQLYLYDVVGEATGATALSIDAIGPVNIQAHGSRFNKDKGVNVTDVLTPSGFIFDPLLIVPKF
jgi:hypothetical protein